MNKWLGVNNILSIISCWLLIHQIHKTYIGVHVDNTACIAAVYIHTVIYQVEHWLFWPSQLVLCLHVPRSSTVRGHHTPSTSFFHKKSSDLLLTGSLSNPHPKCWEEPLCPLITSLCMFYIFELSSVVPSHLRLKKKNWFWEGQKEHFNSWRINKQEHRALETSFHRPPTKSVLQLILNITCSSVTKYVFLILNSGIVFYRTLKTPSQ